MLKYVLSLGAITIDCNPEGREAFHPSWTMRAISAVSNQSPDLYLRTNTCDRNARIALLFHQSLHECPLLRLIGDCRSGE